jgi:hypothetical protein
MSTAMRASRLTTTSTSCFDGRRSGFDVSKYFNPYWLQNGIFLPYYLLSSRDISHGAKLLYRVLEEHVDQKGETSVPLSLPAKILGTNQKNIRAMSRELAEARLIELRHHPADTQFLRCLFLRPAWLVRPQRPSPVPKGSWVARDASRQQETGNAPAANDAQGDAGGSDNHETDGGGEDACQGSRYGLKVILDYVFFRQQIGQAIKSPYGLARHLRKPGAQDEEIRRYLATQQGEADAATL